MTSKCISYELISFNQISLFMKSWPRAPKRPWTCHFSLVWIYHWLTPGADPGFLERGFICINVWVFALLVSLFLNSPWKRKKNGLSGEGFERTPLDPPLDSSQKMNETFLSWVWILSIQHTLGQIVFHSYVKLRLDHRCLYLWILLTLSDAQGIVELSKIHVVVLVPVLLFNTFCNHIDGEKRAGCFA